MGTLLKARISLVGGAGIKASSDLRHRHRCILKCISSTCINSISNNNSNKMQELSTPNRDQPGFTGRTTRAGHGRCPNLSGSLGRSGYLLTFDIVRILFWFVTSFGRISSFSLATSFHPIKWCSQSFINISTMNARVLESPLYIKHVAIAKKWKETHTHTQYITGDFK